MFGGKEARRNRKKGSGDNSKTPAGVNTIDRHTTIRGDLEAGGDIRIDGTLIGDLKCGAKLIIGQHGSVEGDVDCRGAVIEGKYTGNILVRDLLTLADTAHVQGSVRTRKLAVSAGCTIDGQFAVTGETDPATDTQKKLGPARTETTNGVATEA